MKKKEYMAPGVSVMEFQTGSILEGSDKLIIHEDYVDQLSTDATRGWTLMDDSSDDLEED